MQFVTTVKCKRNLMFQVTSYVIQVHFLLCQVLVRSSFFNNKVVLIAVNHFVPNRFKLLICLITARNSVSLVLNSSHCSLLAAK